MLKFLALAAGLMLASAASAQQSLQSMYTRVPAPPATAAAAPAWLASPEITLYALAKRGHRPIDRFSGRLRRRRTLQGFGQLLDALRAGHLYLGKVLEGAQNGFELLLKMFEIKFLRHVLRLQFDINSSRATDVRTQDRCAISRSTRHRLRSS